MKRLRAGKRLPVLLLLAATCLSELGATSPSLGSKLMSNLEHPMKTTVFQRAFPNSKQSQGEFVGHLSSDSSRSSGDLIFPPR